MCKCERPLQKRCLEAHSPLEALQFNPVVVTLKCPVPKELRSDFIHKKSLCLFSHGDTKATGQLRWGKNILCRARAKCANVECTRSHSDAEVCWFNPLFRVADCPEGRACPWKRNCSAFHEDFHKKKRQAGVNEFVGVAKRMKFVERTVKALKLEFPYNPSPVPAVAKTQLLSLAAKAEGNPSATKLKDVVQYLRKHLKKQAALSTVDQEKYAAVLEQMQKVSTARLCMNGIECTSCDESHTLLDVLAFNPLAMVLNCLTPVSGRGDLIHQKGLCPFAHGEKSVSKEFLKAKRLVCDAFEKCKDDKCVKSHSIAEVCWFWPKFRVEKCPQNASCKRKESCWMFHDDGQDKRDAAMNNFVGVAEPVLFVERAHAMLVQHQVQLPLAVAVASMTTTQEHRLEHEAFQDDDDVVSEQGQLWDESDTLPSGDQTLDEDHSEDDDQSELDPEEQQKLLQLELSQYRDTCEADSQSEESDDESVVLSLQDEDTGSPPSAGDSMPATSQSLPEFSKDDLLLLDFLSLEPTPTPPQSPLPLHDLTPSVTTDYTSQTPTIHQPVHDFLLDCVEHAVPGFLPLVKSDALPVTPLTDTILQDSMKPTSDSPTPSSMLTAESVGSNIPDTSSG